MRCNKPTGRPHEPAVWLVGCENVLWTVSRARVQAVCPNWATGTRGSPLLAGLSRDPAVWWETLATVVDTLPQYQNTATIWLSSGSQPWHDVSLRARGPHGTHAPACLLRPVPHDHRGQQEPNAGLRNVNRMGFLLSLFELQTVTDQFRTAAQRRIRCEGPQVVPVQNKFWPLQSS
jgi:hypothetical protein